MAIPPQVVRNTARRRANGSVADTVAPAPTRRQGSDPTSLSLRGNYGIAETPESLPVLQAFHEFIESERKAARGKLVTLSLFFIAVVISLIAAAMFISTTFFDQIRGDMAIVQGESTAARRQLADVRRQTASALTGLGHRTDMLRADFIKDRETMEATHARTASLANRLEEMDEVIKMLELENTSIKKNMVSMTHQLPQVSNALSVAVAEIARLQGLVTEPAQMDVASASSGSSTTIVASLILPGSETETAWHFAIPE